MMAHGIAGRRGPAILAVVLLGALAGGCEPRQPGLDRQRLRTADTDAAFEAQPNLPPSPKTLYAMARLLASQGQDDDAEKALVKIIADYPDFLPAYADLAELRVRHRRLDAAVEALSAGLARAPKDAVLLNNLGMCRVLKADYGAALESFSAAAAAVPQDARYRANMAMALGMLGRYQESLALYRQVLPEAQAHHNLSILCEARGDHERARREAALAAGAAGTAN
jgi:tetratricopeptide (TPR) repeat protein